MMELSGKWSAALCITAVFLTLAGCAYLGKGFAVAWNGGDSDLRIREREWSDFSQGIYPN